MVSGGVAFAHGFDAIRTRYYVRELEKQVADYVGAKYCQAVSSGSAGLYCALKALGIKKGDEVITSAFTFIATIEAIILAGGTPVCVEIGDDYNIDPDRIRITRRTKAIIPVHMAGNPCDMKAIRAGAKGIPIIEDACQAFGAINGKHVGTIGDIGVYSLDGGKIIQCGEGGLVVTSDKKLYERVRMYHDHGHDYSGKRAQEVPRVTGFNFRMTELQAAYAQAQLSKIELIIMAQKMNKLSLLEKIRETRKINGLETYDTIIVEYPSREDAMEKLKKLKIGTKNIPDALNWHYAGRWNHIWPDAQKKWKRTREKLERSIAINVPVKMTKEYTEMVCIL